MGAFSSVVLKNIENSCREEVSVGLSKLVTNELSSFAVGTLAGLVLAFEASSINSRLVAFPVSVHVMALFVIYRRSIFVACFKGGMYHEITSLRENVLHVAYDGKQNKRFLSR